MSTDEAIATSISARSSRSTSPAVVSSTSVRSTSGHSSRNAAAIRGTANGAMVGIAPTTSGPPTPLRASATLRRASRTSARIRRAWSTIRRPASVSTTPRGNRSNIGWPTSRSSLRNCWLRLGEVQDRQLAHFYRADPEYGAGVAAALGRESGEPEEMVAVEATRSTL